MAELLKATGIYYRNELRLIHKNCVKLQPVYEPFNFLKLDDFFKPKIVYPETMHNRTIRCQN